jgi:PAS domain S-box-containing protein
MKSKEEEYHKKRMEKLKAENASLQNKLASIKKQNKHLERSLRNKSSLFDAFPAAIVAVQQKRVVDVNRAALDLFGYTAEQMLGRDFIHFVHPGSKKYAKALHEKRMSGKYAPKKYEIDLIKKDGECLRCDICIEKTQMNGRIAFLARLGRLEDRKRKERELLYAKKAEALNTMASGLSLSVGPSIRRIADHATHLQKSKDLKNHDFQEKLLEIEGAAARIMDTTSKLVRLCGNRQNPPEMTRFDLQEVVREAAEAVKPGVQDAAEKQDVEINFKIYLRSGSAVEGDPREIQDMIVYVIQNALEAMPKGGDLYLSMEESAGFAIIYVQDSGVGMADDIQDRMLDPFFTTKSEGGIGLGLSLCAAIAKRHRGTLDIASKEDQGTVVTIRLPLASREKRSKGRRARKRIKDAHILLIEDDDMVREILFQVLGSKGYRVVSAVSVAEGLSHLKRKAFDMVILGGALSGLNGHALAKKIKAAKTDVPLALIVDEKTIKSVDADEKGVADLIIAKPLNMDQVVNRVCLVLAGGILWHS